MLIIMGRRFKKKNSFIFDMSSKLENSIGVLLLLNLPDEDHKTQSVKN